MDDQTSKGDDDMDHNLKLDPAMDQVLTDLRERWIRARALDAAVAFHEYVGTAIATSVPYRDQEPVYRSTVVNTAKQFEVYIRDGK